MSKEINVSVDKVWSVIGDYNNVYVFHPFLVYSHQVGDITKGIGAKRECHLKNNSSQIEEVIDWVEGCSYTVKATDAPLVGIVYGGMHVESINDCTSRVTVNMKYTPRLGIVGKVLHNVLFQFIFSFGLRKILKSLKGYLETNEKLYNNKLSNQ